MDYFDYCAGLRMTSRKFEERFGPARKPDEPIARRDCDLAASAQAVVEEAALLEAFEARTGCPVLVNTSFNVNEEPIACSPADAFACFMGTDIDCLAMGNLSLRKDAQTASQRAQ